MSKDLRVLLIAPHMSREATGEGFVAFKWAEALSHRVTLTVAALQSPTHTPLAVQLPDAEVVTWPIPKMFEGVTRFRAMLKPEMPIFAHRVRAFLRTEAHRFDLGHQIMPQAMRYTTPLRGHGIPYVMGPAGGALETPQSFAHEVVSAGWFTRLRNLDRLRLKHDPWLKASYVDAAMVLGVAPYIRDILAHLPLKAYENVLELGVDELAPERAATPPGTLRLLHVGRGVRTKGLRDVVRALGYLRDRPEITLTSAGSGEEIEICRMEAQELGVADRIKFMGIIPRAEVEDLYANSDVFAFPSFREPAGNVLYEAMRWGLPVVSAARGGPDSFIDETCGIKIPVTEPVRYACDIAAAIRKLADEPDLRTRLGRGGRNRIEREGLWPKKADHLIGLYQSIL